MGSPSYSDMYALIISSVMVPELTARYPLDQRCLPPKLLPEVGKFLKENPRTCPFQPLDYLAQSLMWKIGDENVNMVASNLLRQYLDLVLHSNLADQVAHTYCHRPSQYVFTVFRNPDQVNLQIVGRVRAYTISSHATILHEFSLRLKARGFHHPRRRH